MARKSRKRSKSRKKRGASVLGDVWGNWVEAPLVNAGRTLEYGVGQVVPGKVGQHMRGVGAKHYYHGQYGSKFGGKRRKSRRRKRRKSRKKRRRSRKRRR